MPATAHALGALDELFQVEQWGEDAEAAARRQAIADDIAVAARLIALDARPECAWRPSVSSSPGRCRASAIATG